jgi:hypothetical protein
VNVDFAVALAVEADSSQSEWVGAESVIPEMDLVVEVFQHLGLEVALEVALDANCLVVVVAVVDMVVLDMGMELEKVVGVLASVQVSSSSA